MYVCACMSCVLRRLRSVMPCKLVSTHTHTDQIGGQSTNPNARWRVGSNLQCCPVCSRSYIHPITWSLGSKRSCAHANAPLTTIRCSRCQPERRHLRSRLQHSSGRARPSFFGRDNENLRLAGFSRVPADVLRSPLAGLTTSDIFALSQLRCDRAGRLVDEW